MCNWKTYIYNPVDISNDFYKLNIKKYTLKVCCCLFILIKGFITRLTRRVPLVEKELPTNPEHLSSPPVFSGGYSIFSFMCMLWRSLFFLLYFFVWSLCCLFFFDIWILITPLVSSNSS